VLAAASLLGRLGATLVITTRSEEKAKEAVKRLRAEGAFVNFLLPGAERSHWPIG